MMMVMMNTDLFQNKNLTAELWDSARNIQGLCDMFVQQRNYISNPQAC